MSGVKRTVAVVLVSLSLGLASLAGCRPAPEKLPSVTFRPPPTAATQEIPLAKTEPDPDGVKFLGVDLGAEVGMIKVNFTGPPKLIDGWNQGSIYVVDEATQRSYAQVGVAPVLGPLFAKPKMDGGPGYVLLMNPGDGLKSGAMVTVVLGKYKREHVAVSQ